MGIYDFHKRFVPFIRSGKKKHTITTGRVAVELNRSAVLLDIAYGNSVYGQLAKGRTTNVQRNLL